MSVEMIAAIMTGITGLIVALGLPKYFEWKREKQDARIKELLVKLDLATVQIQKLKQEVILERERRRTSDSQYHRIIDRFNTNLVYLEIMSEKDEDLKKIVKGLKSTMNITPAPANQ